MVPLTSSVSGLWRGGMKGMLCQWFKTIMSALLSRFLFQKSRKWQLFFKTDNHNKKIFSRFCVELQCFSISFPSFSRLYLSFVVDDAITGIRKSLAERFDIQGMDFPRDMGLVSGCILGILHLVLLQCSRHCGWRDVDGAGHRTCGDWLGRPLLSQLHGISTSLQESLDSSPVFNFLRVPGLGGCMCISRSGRPSTSQSICRRGG